MGNTKLKKKKKEKKRRYQTKYNIKNSYGYTNLGVAKLNEKKKKLQCIFIAIKLSSNFGKQ